MTSRIVSIATLLAVAYTLSPLPCFAGGISLTPSYQEFSISNGLSLPKGETSGKDGQRELSTRVFVTFSNQSSESAKLDFSLAKTMATDVLGRLQFNAPLPQTIYPNNEIARINPESVTLDPGDIATISAEFDSAKLRPGTNAFLLLANIDSPKPSTLNPNASVVQYLASTLLLTMRDGATINLQLIHFDWSSIPIKFSLPDFFTFTLKNDGNTLATPRGLIRFLDPFGHELSRGVINDKSAIVLPGSQRVIYGNTTKTRNPFFISFIKLQIDLHDQTRQSPLSITKAFLYINPWTGLLIPIFGLLFAFFRRAKSRS